MVLILIERFLFLKLLWLIVHFPALPFLVLGQLV